MQKRELREALAQIKKEFEDANLTHMRELEEANGKHARELAEVRAKAKEGEGSGVLLAIVRLTVISH